MRIDGEGNRHLNRGELAAAIMLWLETRGGTFVLDEDRRMITCDTTNVDLSPMTELELQNLAIDLFWELRAILCGRASSPSIDSRGCLWSIVCTIVFTTPIRPIGCSAAGPAGASLSTPAQISNGSHSAAIAPRHAVGSA